MTVVDERAVPAALLEDPDTDPSTLPQRSVKVSGWNWESAQRMVLHAEDGSTILLDGGTMQVLGAADGLVRFDPVGAGAPVASGVGSARADGGLAQRVKASCTSHGCQLPSCVGHTAHGTHRALECSGVTVWTWPEGITLDPHVDPVSFDESDESEDGSSDASTRRALQRKEAARACTSTKCYNQYSARATGWKGQKHPFPIKPMTDKIPDKVPDKVPDEGTGPPSTPSGPGFEYPCLDEHTFNMFQTFAPWYPTGYANGMGQGANGDPPWPGCVPFRPNSFPSAAHLPTTVTPNGNPMVVATSGGNPVYSENLYYSAGTYWTSGIMAGWEIYGPVPYSGPDGHWDDGVHTWPEITTPGCDRDACSPYGLGCNSNQFTDGGATVGSNWEPSGFTDPDWTGPECTNGQRRARTAPRVLRASPVAI